MALLSERAPPGSGVGERMQSTVTIRGWRARILRPAWRVLVYAMLVAGSAIYGFPFAWMVRSSFMTIDQFYEDPPPFFPLPPNWSSYTEVWETGPIVWWIANSTIVTVLGVVLMTFVSAVVAFGFARTEYPIRDALFLLVISTMMLPEHVTIIPKVIIFRDLGWLDTLLPLTVPMIGGSAFFIFILRQFFRTIPRELDDAAAIDGASPLRVMFTIVFPLSKPAIATVAVFSFIGKWNEFFEPFIYLNTPERMTFAVGLRFFQAGMWEQPQLHLQMAVALIAVAPIVVIFFFAQQHFVRGITLTGIKG
ncbi:MAG: carbohydrate ABC transporter permease [Chloroflexi bacterium]|nr:carbohydrate ABC transporter permease [Chloroflexota bacterium]